MPRKKRHRPAKEAAPSREPDPFYDYTCGICKKQMSRETEEKEALGAIISIARVMEGNCFDYGISGVFKLKKDFGLKPGDVFCTGCVKQIIKDELCEEAKTVPCSHCKELHQPVRHDSMLRDGFGCNSDVYEKDGEVRLGSGWGSKYDTGVYLVKVPVVKPGDQVCDVCIEMFLREKSIVEHPVFYGKGW